MAKALESPSNPVSVSIPGGIDATITDDRSGKKLGIVAVVPMAVAGTEYTYTLPSEARGFSAKLLSGTKLLIRFQNAGDYKTISAGVSYDLERLSPDSGTVTLRFKSTQNSDSLEVETWS